MIPDLVSGLSFKLAPMTFSHVPTSLFVFSFPYLLVHRGVPVFLIHLVFFLPQPQTQSSLQGALIVFKDKNVFRKIWAWVYFCIKIFFLEFTYLLERWKEGQRERDIDVSEKHPLVASHMPPVGNLACNPGMCPDWESNQQPFSSQASARSTEPHQPGQS